jgi:hypothetical protein
MITAYRVYRAEDASDPAFCAEYDTRAEAQECAEREPDGLEKSMWETARAAGHVGGQVAPDAAGIEADEPVSWHGAAGWHCVVAVQYPDGHYDG